MGLLRFLLAVLVVLSHLGITFFGLNPGVIAVVVFFMLAGFVVQGMLVSGDEKPVSALAYYYDRILRIMPLYIVAVIGGGLIWYLGGKSHFLSGASSFENWVANLTVVPLNFYMYSGIDNFTLVPPAWSLGLEMQFYLLAPFLVRHEKFTWALVFASSLVFIAAQFNVINSDYWGYRLLPGTLFIFKIGMIMRKAAMRDCIVSRVAGCGFVKIGILGIVLVNIIYFLWMILADIRLPFTREVALGLALGVPALWVAQRYDRKVREWGFVRMLGGMSYPIFLFHFFVLWAFEPLLNGMNSIYLVLTVLSATVIVAIIAHRFIELPIWRLVRAELKGCKN